MQLVEPNTAFFDPFIGFKYIISLLLLSLKYGVLLNTDKHLLQTKIYIKIIFYGNRCLVYLHIFVITHL